MPARWTPIDPTAGEVESFAADLRELGKSKTPVSYIADAEPWVSRAALYAALSGGRLPRRKTIAALLRWWVPASPVRAEPGEWEWDWVYSLKDKEAAEVATQWMERHRALSEIRFEWPTRRREPVAIDEPPEQRRFIEKLRKVLEAHDLIEGIMRWDEDYECWVTAASGHNVQRYLAGTVIPEDDTISSLLALVPEEEQAAELLLELVRLAQEARRARVRSRRLARATDSSKQL
ncbi:hypothetical protein KQY30_17790 [Streptomyces sp. GMY02]|uniref:hypothetical protein n=1 Tax=Streptomyces sp. GMY02 TaxID=1333528 RepID=UPI001C2B9C3F|nr:hypothetical protein [Streptomyces sp. GMY02]QXE35838.1 hypothetical protein KQY30_17790 [Streptomyces sp. GMY02]